MLEHTQSKVTSWARGGSGGCCGAQPHLLDVYSLFSRPNDGQTSPNKMEINLISIWRLLLTQFTGGSGPAAGTGTLSAVCIARGSVLTQAAVPTVGAVEPRRAFWEETTQMLLNHNSGKEIILGLFLANFMSWWISLEIHFYLRRSVLAWHV